MATSKPIGKTAPAPRPTPAQVKGDTPPEPRPVFTDYASI